MNTGDRSFTIEKSEVHLPDDATSRYISKTPSGAASKAARRLFTLTKDNKVEIRFTLRETTQGSNGKMYRYIGIRQKFDNPKVVSLGGKEVSYSQIVKVKSCRMDK